MTEKETEPVERVKLVYAGVREGKGNRLFHIYYMIGEDGKASGEDLWFSKTLLKRSGRPGGIIECDIVTKEDDGFSILGPGREYAGRYDDKDQVVGWQVLHDAIKDARAKTRERSRNLVREHLEPVRWAYRQANAKERRHMLAYIFAYISRPS